MIPSLATKELRHHAAAFCAATALSASVVVMLVQHFISEEASTLLRAATGFTWGAGPMLAAYLARRVFVLEREMGTHALLDSLPAAPATVLAVKTAAVLCGACAVTLGALWITAGLVQRQELAPAAWLWVLSVQVVAYVFAWSALAILMAHLGRYRFAGWICALLLLIGVDPLFDEPLRHVWWTAPLADPLDAVRYAPPWGGVALAGAWGAGFLAASLGLAMYRGGALTTAWYAPMSTRRQAQVVAGIFVLLVALTLAEGVDEPPPVPPDSLPRVGRHAIIAGAASLEPVAAELDEAMTELTPVLDVTAWPRISLVPRRQRRVWSVRAEPLGDDGVLLRIQPGVDPEAAATNGLRDVLALRGGARLSEVPGAEWIIEGFATWWRNRAGADTTALARRVAFAGDVDAASWSALKARVGQKTATAVAWAAWRAVEAEAGPGAVRALAKAALGPRESLSPLTLLSARLTDADALIEDATGLSREAFRAAWAAERARLTAAQAAWLERAPQAADVLRLRPTAAAWEVVYAHPGPRLELRWSTVDPLARYAFPRAEPQRRPLDAPAGTVTLPLDPRERLTAALVVHLDEPPRSLTLGWKIGGAP